MKKIRNAFLITVEAAKSKVIAALKDEKGSITIEGLLFIVVMVGLVILVFKPQITTTLTNVMSIWNTDITTMFNNAQ